jgi:HIV Tat-specific factor 1
LINKSAEPKEADNDAEKEANVSAFEKPKELAEVPLSAEELKAKELKRLKRKRHNDNKKKKWFEAKSNTYIYVEGLPLDIEEEELSAFFKKCGIIKLDPTTGEESIRIYRDKTTNEPKGDARIGFAKVESVTTALEMLDGAYLRPDVVIKVSQAQFEQKGEEYQPRKIQKTDKLTQMMIKNK